MSPHVGFDVSMQGLRTSARTGYNPDSLHLSLRGPCMTAKEAVFELLERERGGSAQLDLEAARRGWLLALSDDAAAA